MKVELLEVLLDLALGADVAIAKEAADVLKHKFFFMRLIQIV
jgi:hypothetical protein